MSMVIANNLAALNALNTLNGNTNALGKSLKQVASGERINNAGDDASGYSISEKMKAQIRALGQCDQNTKTAHSMLNIASEAVNQQVEIMRKVYTIALKASDDTYTDFDRGILQKELNQLHTEIEDIAQETTYNGRYLLNVGKVEKAWFDSTQPFAKNDPPLLKPSSTGVPTTTAHPNLRSEITGWTTSTHGHYATSGGTGSYVAPGSGLSVGQVPPPPPPSTWTSGVTYPYYDTEMEIDLSAVGSLKKIPDDLKGMGFSAACGDCSQFVVFSFNTEATRTTKMNDSGKGANSVCYDIGVKNVTSVQDLYNAIFNGIKSVNGSKTNKFSTTGFTEAVQLAPGHDMTLQRYSNGKLTITRTSNRLVFCDGIIGTVSQPADPGQHLWVQGDEKASQATQMYVPKTTLASLYKAGAWEPTEENPEPNPLLSDCVSTRDKASSFLNNANIAIDYLLNANTTLGAELSRLGFMSNNIVNEHENVTNAESVIRDADMAKAMADFTKNNILTQAAQSMLAQANQNSSNVLSLLQ